MVKLQDPERSGWMSHLTLGDKCTSMSAETSIVRADVGVQRWRNEKGVMIQVARGSPRPLNGMLEGCQSKCPIEARRVAGLNLGP